MHRNVKILAAVGAIGFLFLTGELRAQYTGPINPNFPPTGNYQPPAYYPPVQTYYPITPQYPQYNPNGVASQSGGANVYWDGYRWVTNTQSTQVLNSATSPGRAPVGPVQYYNQWNGIQWVRGSRWLGQDGQWHGEDTSTTNTGNGTDTQRRFYSPGPPTGRVTNTQQRYYNSYGRR